MQTSQLSEDANNRSEPCELDPSLWSEVGGGSPKGTWGAILGADRFATEQPPTDAG